MANTNNKRGFAAMEDDKQRGIASQGGKAAQASGHAHTLTPEERSRGGQHSGGNFANRDPKEVAAIGRKGGQSSHGGGSGSNNQSRQLRQNEDSSA